MKKTNSFTLRIVFISASLCCAPLAMAENNVDYNSVNLGALQSQYQKQLKPKIRRKVAIKTSNNRKQLQNKELLQYQRLLNRQPQKVQRSANGTVRLVPKQSPIGVQRQAVPVTRPTKAPAPKRDALFEAASSGNVRLIGQLLNQGVNVNQANSERETALHMAAAKGHYSAVIYLLNHGANIHARTTNNWLAIHHATRFRHAQIANYLKQRGSPIHARTSDGLSAIDMAKAVNDRRILGIFGVR